MANIKDVEKNINNLVARIKLKNDYHRFLSTPCDVILVEGSTDLKFIERVKSEQLVCIDVGRVMNSNQAFRINQTSNLKFTQSNVNSKDVICKVIKGISQWPSTFLKLPKEIENWNIFGIVDLDFEESCQLNKISKLFVTDTHDLETLLISTDDALLNRIIGEDISIEQLQNSFFVAFQMAKIREFLNQFYDSDKFDLSAISCGSKDVDFSSFLDVNKINIDELINYIVGHSNVRLKNPEITKIKDKALKFKYIDSKTGLWKSEISNFNISTIKDFWKLINGHDLLQLIQFYCEKAGVMFRNKNSYGLNRRFEFEIIEKYNYQNFTKTQLYSSLNSNNLLRDFLSRK